MSTYKTRMNCPECSKETSGMAIDDYFAHHVYGLKCDECNSVWRMEDCEVIYEPKRGVKYFKEVAPDESTSNV